MTSKPTTSNPADNRGAHVPGTTLGSVWRLLAGTICALVAAELFLRVFAPVPMLPRYVIATDFGIRGNQPNQTYTHRTPDYTVEIRTNSRGIRADEEIPYTKPPGVKRILVLGDSFSLGYGVNLEDTFFVGLENRLEPHIGPVQIVNLAVSGHGNAEELIMLREEGLKYEPDLILLGWHRTDLDDNVRSALFELDGDALIRKNEIFLPQVELREFLFGFAAYRWLAGNCHLYNFVREGLGKVAKSTLATMRQITRKPRPPAPVETDISIPSDGNSNSSITTPSLRYPERLTIALLTELEREAREAGARLVILDIPNSAGRTRFSSSFPDLNGSPLSDDLHVVSPLAKFDENRGKLIYWERSHYHFTPFGCELVSQVLADYIRENGLL